MGTVAEVVSHLRAPPITLSVVVGSSVGFAGLYGMCCSGVGPSGGTDAERPYMLAANAPALARGEVCASNSICSREVSMSPSETGLKPDGRVVVDVKVGPLAVLRCVSWEPATDL